MSMPRSQTPAMALSRHMGTIKIIASGSDQLSYWAARVRKTNSTQSGKIKTAVLPARISCRVNSVHSKPIVEGRFSAASFSIVAMAWPVLMPGEGEPLNSADGYML